MNIQWLLGALILACVLAGAHMYALAEYLYWHYPWFDIPMHILGGIVIAVFSVGLLKKYNPYGFLGIISVAFIGWEIFEFLFHISTGQPDYIFDTLHDVVNNFIGAGIIYLLAKKTLWHSV